MRTITAATITTAISELVQEAACVLPPDVVRALRHAARRETTARARRTMQIILENARIARTKRLPICQDTGMTVVSCAIGRAVRIAGDIEAAIQRGVRIGSRKGLLRTSVVGDPLVRVNTNTNGPAIVQYAWIRGNRIQLSVLLKGFGCENKSRVVMLQPTVSYEQLKKEIISVISDAGANACPPFVIGVGIGGTQDKAASLAKEALLEPIGRSNKTPWYARLERDILREANKLGVGPLGFGGRTTVLGVAVKSYPTHIAGLPVAINISCHALRRRTTVV